MPKENKKIKVATTATGALRILWQKGLFKAAKKQSDIVKHLAEQGYNFTDPELGMALLRAKYLTRHGKKGSYEYIQKHPYTEDEPK